MAGGLFGRLFGRGERDERRERFAVPPCRPATTCSRALARVEAMVAAGAVPAPVASRVRRVDRVVRDTIPRLASLGPAARRPTP